jgi:REP element-mobilizing transposase RayT
MGENEFFLDDGDAKGFCIRLVEVCEWCGWKVHAYVLMSNHVRLLLETQLLSCF